MFYATLDVSLPLDNRRQRGADARGDGPDLSCRD